MTGRLSIGLLAMKRKLTEIGGLLDAQRLRTFVAAAVPLSKAAEAYSGKIRKNRPGKLVVLIATEEAP